MSVPYFSQQTPPFKWRAVGAATVAWLAGSAAVGTVLSALAHVGLAFQVWSLVLGLCGALTNVPLLMWPRFRRMHGGRVVIVWLSTMLLILGVTMLYFLASSAPRSVGILEELVTTGVYGALPTLFAAIAVNWVVK